MLVLPKIASERLVQPITIEQVRVRRRCDTERNRFFSQVSRSVARIRLKRKLSCRSGRFSDSRLRQRDVVFVQIESDGIALKVLSSHQRGAGSAERIENQLAPMCEQPDAASRKTYGINRRMNFLIPDIAPFVIKFPNGHLAFKPILGRHATDVVWWAAAYANVADFA